MKLRVHHIYCVPFLKHISWERGDEFIQVANRIKQTMHGQAEEPVEVIWGVDELCQVCPMCKNDRCQSPEGDEEEIRKMDSIILKGLGVSVGTVLTVGEWRKLIEQKAPLEICRRCRARSICDAGTSRGV